MEWMDKASDFVAVIPTADGYNLDSIDSEGLERMQPFVSEAKRWLWQEVLGNAFEQYVEQTQQDEHSIVPLITTIVGLRAYEMAIPFLDLQQTPTGFAVISNGNLAPASRDRVERLIEWVRLRQCDALDALLVRCLTVPALRELWKQAYRFHFYTEALFFTTSDFRKYAKAEVKRVGMEVEHSLLMFHQQTLGKMLSHEMIDHLVTARIEGTLAPHELPLLSMFQAGLGLLWQGKQAEAYSLCEGIVNIMVSRIADFPAYASSEAYALKMAEKFKNDPNGVTFFGSV